MSEVSALETRCSERVLAGEMLLLVSPCQSPPEVAVALPLRFLLTSPLTAWLVVCNGGRQTPCNNK
jgi:hypothetical protein